MKTFDERSRTVTLLTENLFGRPWHRNLLSRKLAGIKEELFHDYLWVGVINFAALFEIIVLGLRDLDESARGGGGGGGVVKPRKKGRLTFRPGPVTVFLCPSRALYRDTLFLSLSLRPSALSSFRFPSLSTPSWRALRRTAAAYSILARLPNPPQPSRLES